MIEVIGVKRQNGMAKEVTVSTGSVKIIYILGQNGQPQAIGKLSQNQVLDDQSLYISPVDYRQAVRTVAAIFKEKRKKAF